MGLLKQPPTPEELEQQKRYEASKIRLMELHKTSKTIFYIDDVTTDPTSHQQILIGEMGIGQLHPGDILEIYSCEGLSIGTMTVDKWEEQAERHAIIGNINRILCYPKETWDGYVPGQLLAKSK